MGSWIDFKPKRLAMMFKQSRYFGRKGKFFLKVVILTVVICASYWLWLKLSRQVCMDLTLDRANRLLRIIQDKEAQFRDELSVLKVPQLFELLDRKEAINANSFMSTYKRQIDLFGQMDRRYFAFNQAMIDTLEEKSRYHSFESPVNVFPLLEPRHVI